MKCHYDVLGISMNASADEIKKAYRRAALEWHPDKNLERLEEAKEAFQLVQQAYEVLSDVQERAWYDRHREDILNGGYENEETLDVYQYFNTSCFKGYGDDEKSFYTVYRDVFVKIAAEDEKFMDEPEVEIPSFGYSYSPYEEVHAFYAHWQSYCTAKTYSWVDKHDLSEYRKANVGRQVLRAVEKENKKLRDQHKKLRNEEVRQLVAYVRKRDKRIQAHQKLIEEQNAEKARKFQEMRKQQILERHKDLQSYKETEWCSISQVEDHYNEIEAHLDVAFNDNASCENGHSSETEYQDLYCAACDKDFRSVKAMKNHENSKKHKENAELLKSVMLEEEEEMASEQNETDSATVELKDSECEESEGEVPVVKRTNKKKKKKKTLKYNLGDKEEEVLDDVLTNIEQKTRELSIEENGEVTEALPKCEEIIPEKETKPKEAKKKKSKSATVSDEKNKPSTHCEKCGHDFHSRNKLFDHLKESGHAVYLGDHEASRKVKNNTKKGSKKGNR